MKVRRALAPLLALMAVSVVATPTASAAFDDSFDDFAAGVCVDTVQWHFNPQLSQDPLASRAGTATVTFDGASGSTGRCAGGDAFVRSDPGSFPPSVRQGHSGGAAAAPDRTVTYEYNGNCYSATLARYNAASEQIGYGVLSPAGVKIVARDATGYYKDDLDMSYELHTSAVPYLQPGCAVTNFFGSVQWSYARASHEWGST